MRKLAGTSTINTQAMRLLAWLGGLVVLSYVWRGLVTWLDPSWKPLTAYWLPSLIELFCVGMALAVISAWADHRSVVRSATDAIGRHPAVCWLIAIGLFWFVSTQLGLLLGLFRASDGREMLRQTIYGLVALFLMLPAVFGDQRKGLLRRFLSHPFMAYMGSISYGIYLWHQFFITHISDWFGWGQWEAPFPQLFLMTMVLSSATVRDQPQDPRAADHGATQAGARAHREGMTREDEAATMKMSRRASMRWNDALDRWVPPASATRGRSRELPDRCTASCRSRSTS